MGTNTIYQSDSISIMKLVHEGSEQHSVRSGSHDRPHSLTKSVEKIVDKYFTPKSKEDQFENKEFSQDDSQISEIVKEERHGFRPGLTDRTERSVQNLSRLREGEEFGTPKPRSSDLIQSTIVFNNVNRPPPSTPAVPKQQVNNLIAKFQSQKRLRESLQSELERARQENETLKSRTEEISDRLQQSEIKVRRLADSSRKDQQTQLTMLLRENQQLKDDNKQMRYSYEQEKAISESVQRQLIELNHSYETEKQNSLMLQRQVDECRVKHQQSTAVSPQSLKSSNLSDRTKFVGELSRVENAYRQKQRYCLDLERDLQQAKRLLCEAQLQLEQQRQHHFKAMQANVQATTANQRELELEQRVIELEEELQNQNNLRMKQSEDDFVNRVIEEFNRKEQQIQAIFGVLEKECMRLINNAPKNKPMTSASVQTNLIDEPFSYAQSPIRAAQPQLQDYQASTDDLRLSVVYDHVIDEQELARMRSENESLREQARDLQNSLMDSRRTLWDFKETVFRNTEKSQHQKSQRSIVKAERSIRYRHHLRHIDRLKMEYTDKLRQMYEEIMHLNEVIYLNSAKQKEMGLEVQQIQEKYKFMESASRQMRERLKQCREKHHDTIEGLKATNARQVVQIAKLKDTVCEQQQQLNSLKVQVDNMDNSDLLVVTNPGEYEQLQIEISKVNSDNRQLQRRCGQMMNYIEQLRNENQKAEQLLILKDSELEDVREQLRRKKLTLASQSQHILLVDEEQPSYSHAIRQVLEILRSNLKGSQQMREVKQALKVIFDIYAAADATEDVSSRAEKLIIMERIRQFSVEFQRLKIDRIKALEGSSQLRKQFLRSIRPMQAKLDELLAFGQGVLNSKSNSYRRPLHQFQQERNMLHL